MWNVWLFISHYTLHISHFKKVDVFLRQGEVLLFLQEDEKYLLTTIRYIHQNPVKAGMVEKIDEYEYSSYNEYKK